MDRRKKRKHETNVWDCCFCACGIVIHSEAWNNHDVHGYQASDEKKNIPGKRYLQIDEQSGNLFVYVICGTCGWTVLIKVEIGVGCSIEKICL